VPVQVLVTSLGSWLTVFLNFWITRYALYSRRFSNSHARGSDDIGGGGGAAYLMGWLSTPTRPVASEVRAASAMQETAKTHKRARRLPFGRPAIFPDHTRSWVSVAELRTDDVAPARRSEVWPGSKGALCI
jgi:hypothetical protein